ncbi:unnamed protein product, partial [Rotaria magnacalcarata]
NIAEGDVNAMKNTAINTNVLVKRLPSFAFELRFEGFANVCFARELLGIFDFRVRRRDLST